MYLVICKSRRHDSVLEMTSFLSKSFLNIYDMISFLSFFSFVVVLR